MSDYNKATNFATKDTLSTGNPAKAVKGTEIDNEFNAIASAIASKAEPSDITDAVDAAIAGLSITGRLVQIVESVTSTGVESFSDTLVGTGHTATITPTATSSKILILTSFGFAQTNAYANNAANAYWTLYRGSSNLASSSGFLGMANVNTINSQSNVYIQESYQLLDSPNTTSSITYQTYVRRSGNASAGYNTMGNGRIILLEISQ